MKLKALGAALLFSSTAFAQTPPPTEQKPLTPETAAPQQAPTPPPVAPPPQAAPIVAPVAPAAAPAAPAFKFAMKGFISMSGAWQSGSFTLSDGQQSLAATTPAGIVDKSSLTFDVRQSRFNFSVTGPKVLAGATPSGVLEIDFFQGFGGGNFGDVSLLNRMRLAYSELNWVNHRLQFGQQNDLIFAMAPTSLSHIGFPLGYFTGNLGWRRPGIFGFHTFPVSSDTKVELAWEAGRSQWADVGGGSGAAGVPGNGIGAAGTNTPNFINLGAASGAPALEGRLSLTVGKLASAFVAAHWNQVDLTGVGPPAGGGSPAASPRVNTLDVYSYHAGAKVVLDLAPMALTLQATGFTGRNVSALIGQFIDFKYGPASDPNVDTIGWWAQAGLNLTKEFSLWGFYGQQKPNRSDAERALLANIENKTTNVIVMYRDGGYGLSAEWIHFDTTQATYSGAVPGTSTLTATRVAKANQFMGTATYFF